MDELVKNIEKLRSNETQMNEKQKKQYAKALAKLRGKIKDDAVKFAIEFVIAGCIFAEDAENDPGDREAAICMMRKIIDDSRHGIGEAVKGLFENYKFDDMLLRLLPLRSRIWHEAYGPYWLAHCRPTAEEEYTFTNDLIGMEWWESSNEWAATKIEAGKKVTDYQRGVTIMLPPTKELLDQAYEDDKKRLAV